MANELLDSAFVEKAMLTAGALVEDFDSDTSVEEGKLSQALRENIETEVCRFEDQRIWLEGNAGTALFRRANFLKRRFRLPPLIALAVDLTVAAYLHFQELGKSVYYRDTYSMEPAGNLVRLPIEFAARVEACHHHFDSTHAFLLVDVHRDSPAVVLDSHRTVDVQRNPDVVTKPGQGLIDRVIHHLEHQVMKTSLTGVPDVHPRPLTNCL
jgi:hypothetical protein